MLCIWRDWKDQCALGSPSIKSNVEFRYVLFKMVPLKATHVERSFNWSVRWQASSISSALDPWSLCRLSSNWHRLAMICQDKHMLLVFPPFFSLWIINYFNANEILLMGRNSVLCKTVKNCNLLQDMKLPQILRNIGEQNGTYLLE